MFTNTMLDPGDRNWPLSPSQGAHLGGRREQFCSVEKHKHRDEPREKHSKALKFGLRVKESFLERRFSMELSSERHGEAHLVLF